MAWSLYDWANSAFATTVMAGFFPVFFKEFWSAGSDASLSTLKLGTANSLASLLLAATAPLLGAIADTGGAKKKSLFLFACLGILCTGSLYWVGRGEWVLAACLYVVAVLGFAGGNIFYDSLLVTVADEEKIDFVSALGFSLGYLGGGILFAINVGMTLWPGVFRLSSAAEAVRLSFISVSLWWAFFSIPLFLFVHEPAGRTSSGLKQGFIQGLLQLKATFAEVRKLRVVMLFLAGYWLYIDGVDTIIRMAVDYGLSLGFSSRSLLTALIVTQFVGFPSAIAFGVMGRKWGPKTGIFIGIGAYVGVTVYGYFITDESEFYVLAGIIGLVQGGVQSLSRSLYARIIPRDKAAEFFGFYNMLGKFAAVVGPLLMGWVSVLTGSPRHSILAIVVLFLSGGLLLRFVDEKEGRKLARSMENGQRFEPD
jgi:UMF1 family MFS transporter